MLEPTTHDSISAGMVFDLSEIKKINVFTKNRPVVQQNRSSSNSFLSSSSASPDKTCMSQKVQGKIKDQCQSPKELAG